MGFTEVRKCAFSDVMRTKVKLIYMYYNYIDCRNKYKMVDVTKITKNIKLERVQIENFNRKKIYIQLVMQYHIIHTLKL